VIATTRLALWLVAATATIAFVAADKLNNERTSNDQGESAAPNHSPSSVTDSAEPRPRLAVRSAARDPFSPPPPPAPPPTPPPAPVIAPPPAPPLPLALPFRYFGRMTAPDGTMGELVESNGRLLAAQKGEVIDEVYRIDEVGDAEIVFMHLPTQQRLSLPIPPP